VEEEVGAADVKALGCEAVFMEEPASEGAFAVSAVAEDAESVGGIGGSVMFTSLAAADTEVEAG
jgi:hypothetical protein